MNSDPHSDPTRPESHLSSSSSSTLSVSKTSEGCTGLGSSTSNSSKENVDITENKTGTPNLSMLPQKMKKGKKNGGYNLRKSLAWDRAFFTEEGVLDSLELSKITGIPDKLNGDGLSVINEHGTDPNSYNVGSFLNLETLEEDLFKELPSGTIKTKSSQRIPPQHDVSRTVVKGRVTSSPMASTSQKRLLNTGARNVTPRNSKIPKFSASNQNTCLPSITASRAGERRNSLKSNGISQSAQKNVTSKVSFNSKNASNATKLSSECTSKSCKPSTENAKKDMAIPHLDVRNHPAQHTTKCSILSEMTPNKGPSTGATGAIKSIDKIRGTTVLSHRIAGCIDNSKKNLQSQGAKPSGLRMPSPSLRFFSEPKAPISYVPPKKNPSTSKPLKSSIPVSMNLKAVNHAHNLKPAQLLPGVIISDATGKSNVSSQMMDKCPSSSILDPTTNCNVTENEENQQVVEEQVPRGAKSFKQTNEKQSRSQHLDISGKCHMHQVPPSIEYKEDDNKYKDVNLVLSHVECAEATHTTPIFFNIGNETISTSSVGSSCEKQLNCASETIREVQPKLVEDMEHNTPAMKDEVMPGFQNSYINCSRLSPASDGGTLSSSLYDNKPSEKRNICSFKHNPNERSMDAHIGGGSSLKQKDDDSVILVCEDRDVIIEKSEGEQLCSSTKNSAECNQLIGDYDHKQLHVSSEGDILAHKKLPTMDADKCLEALDDVLVKGHQLRPSSGFFKDKQYFLKSKDLHCKDISNVSLGHANDEEDDMVIDTKWPTVDANECLEVQGKVRGKDYQQLKSGDFFLDDKQSLLDSKNFDNKKVTNVGPEVQAHKMNANTEDVTDKKLPMLIECLEAQGNVRETYYQPSTSTDFSFNKLLRSENFNIKDISSLSPDVQAHRLHESKGRSGEPESSSFLEVVNEGGVQVDHTYMTFRHEQLTHPCEHGTIDSEASDICTSISDTQCLDGTSDANNLEERCASTNELPKKEPMTRSIESNWGATMVLLEHSTQFRNHEERQVEISNDMYEMSNSSEKVYQTEFLVSTSGNESKDQALNMEHHSSAMESTDQEVSHPVTIPETENSCSSNTQHKLQPRDESMNVILEEYIEYDKPESSVSPREPEKRMFQNVNCINSENLCSEKDTDCMCQEDTNSKLITSNDGEKLTRSALNVVPFSDEWLAAIEAAGEEILTLKTGAVQNSPPDKPIPEPSPWSPVKKNNQEIGPFDCTKHKNAQHISD